MAGLTTTLAALNRYRRALGVAEETSHLAEVTSFGDNPAGLRMFAFVPEGLAADAGLLVALHGCTETATEFDLACGWSVLAARHGFAVLLPQQQARNNPAGCFNWFRAEEQRRDGKEVASVMAMVDHMLAQHRLDPRLVGVTGLSAGGALAASLLALHPGRFAAGAILAGLPFAVAHDMGEGMALMAKGTALPAEALVTAARTASKHEGGWPRVAVWHGMLDTVVAPGNADALARQFRGLHGLPDVPGDVHVTPMARVETWRDRAGHAVVTQTMVCGLGHAVPLSLADLDPDLRVGQIGPFAQEVGVAACWQIAEFLGLVRHATRPRGHWFWPFG